LSSSLLRRPHLVIARRFVSFFLLSDAPRDLPSFPTRRSSDLFVQDHDRRRIPAERRVRESIYYPEPDDSHPLTPTASDARCASRDRKSTRLNSSHGSISYAVFCLKTKTGKTYRKPHAETQLKT